MNTMTLYVDRNSIIHRMDPLTKLLYVVVSIAITYIMAHHIFVMGVMLFSFLMLLTGKVFRKILPIFGISLVLIISIIIVQGFFHPKNETVLYELWGVPLYKEGFSYALLLTMRVLNMLSAFGILILTTKPDELIERLVRKGISPKIGYVFLSVLQIIPQMQQSMQTITDAQRSRGMETEGNVFVRIKAFFPLIGPVVLNAIKDTRERAIALEVRGFNSPNQQTFLNEPIHYRFQGLVKIALVIVLLATIVWRFWL
ncbi:MAG TPA: energy-coupling factor transporter transmembrane component T [Virgibacillus sp.]|nr:energy-coupling factor transporter transmembrane component T [Virgibacillus sp.]